MNFFKKRGEEKTKATAVFAGLPRPGDVLPASLKAHSQFIKRVNCSQCQNEITFEKVLANAGAKERRPGIRPLSCHGRVQFIDMHSEQNAVRHD